MVSRDPAERRGRVDVQEERRIVGLVGSIKHDSDRPEHPAEGLGCRRLVADPTMLSICRERPRPFPTCSLLVRRRNPLTLPTLRPRPWVP